MQIHINSYDKGVWEAILNGLTPVTYVVDGVTVPKPKNLWDEKDEKKWSCDWKAKNIIIFTIDVDKLYYISHYQTAKAMWDALQVTYEGTNKVKQAIFNTLNQDFKLFRMKQGETIAQMQNRFSHLINCLSLLGNPISKDISTNKVLRCLTRN